MRKSVLFLLAAATIFAGCSSPPKADPAAAQDQVQYQSPVLNLAVPTMPRDPPAAGERTLDAAPQWRLGEWWTYHMEDKLVGGSMDFTRVVAGEDKQAGTYLVGFPLDEFSNNVMLFHIPGYGDISQADLSYETHDKVFQPLQFPLAEGNSWPVAFEGTAKGQAGVVRPGDGTAQVTMEVSNYGYINATYDPAIGEIREMDIKNYAHYEVTGHGYNWKGVVRVPHAHDLIFQHGRIAALFDVRQPLVPPTPTAPTETVDIPAGYDRASFVIILGAGAALGIPNAVPAGVFRETVTSPNGTKYELTLLPNEGGLKIGSYGNDAPTGTWTMEHVAGGAGIAFVEGIGYHSIDIDLPSGCAIKSANAMHHGGLCKIDSSQAGQLDANGNSMSQTTTG
jgi:hypothetical protein